MYTQIFSPEKNWFFPRKTTFQNFFDFCLPSMQLFSVDPKKFEINFLSIKNFKKRASKVA
jgi:hypothetical protein